MSPRPRPGILDIKAYAGGGAGIEGRGRVIRLASNENPLGASRKAVAAYQGLAGDLHRYPDGGAHELRAAIAAMHNLPAGQIVCGAGSDELISLLVRGYAGPGDAVLYSAHGFLMYAIAAKAAGATPVAAPERDLTADVDALLAHANARTRLVFLANPNNPTGSYLPVAELQRLRDGLPADAILVIDAAYAEYVRREDYEAGSRLVDAGDNTVMLRTFSKVHGLAALRLGWGYFPPAIADVLNRTRGPFNVAAAALAAGTAAIQDRGFIERSADENAAVMGDFAARLRDLGYAPCPSVGNFLLLPFPQDDPARGADAALAHLKARGILVRAVGDYGLGHCLRISIGTAEEMQAVAEALTEFAG